MPQGPSPWGRRRKLGFRSSRDCPVLVLAPATAAAAPPSFLLPPVLELKLAANPLALTPFEFMGHSVAWLCWTSCTCASIWNRKVTGCHSTHLDCTTYSAFQWNDLATLDLEPSIHRQKPFLDLQCQLTDAAAAMAGGRRTAGQARYAEVPCS